MSIGEKIQQLRKSQGLSQEQLADSLNVSRQAISKWETDQSSPEIDNILALSKMFSVSTDELLGNDDGDNGNVGARNGEDSSFKTSSTMEDIKRTISFTKQAKGLFVHIDKKVCFIIFTVLCIIAIGVCIIVDFALNKQITWAAYPILSVIVGWLILFPLIYRKYTISLCLLFVTVIPFLYFLNKITPEPDWFYGMGVPISIVGIVMVLVTYLLFRFAKINIWYKLAITVFLAGIVSAIIDYIVDDFLRTNTSLIITIINFLSCLLIAVLLWITGYLKNKAKSAAQ